jgi:nickel/cobalt transporter (NicO) family protein
MISHWRWLAAGCAGLMLVAVLLLLASADAGGAGLLHGLFALVNGLQRELYRSLATAVRNANSATSIWPLLVLYGISLLYGVLHAVGPGHGKAVISSYLVASRSRIVKGVILSFAASLVQAVSAVAMVGVLALAFGLTRIEIDTGSQWLEQASYGTIVLIGLWMLVSAWRGGMHRHSHHHAHHPELGEAPRNATSTRQYAAILLATGMRPCTGAVLVLLFALAQGMFVTGVVAAFVMALGTAITISALAALAVLSRHASLRLAGADEAWHGRIERGLAFFGGFVVVAAGLFLLMASLATSPSI